jgi:hypothetical protein
MREPLVSCITHHNEPIMAGGLHLQLTSQTLHVHLPFANHTDLFWSRPVFITWQIDSASRQVTPITDITRVAQVAILGIIFLGALLFCISIRRNELTREHATPNQPTQDN